MSELDDYRSLVKKRRTERPLIELLMPSGATWRLYPVNTSQYAISGRLPTEMLVKQQSGKLELSTADQIELGLKAMELTRDVMLNNLVFPRITLEPEPDSICIKDVGDELDPDDFEYFAQWLMKGGQVTQDSFRKPTNGEPTDSVDPRSLGADPESQPLGSAGGDGSTDSVCS